MRQQAETIYAAFMKFMVLPAFVVSLTTGVAFAQQGPSPLMIEGAKPVPLGGANPPEQALAGDEYLLSFALRSRADIPVSLRRIALRVPEGLEVLDPNADRIDNDRDGQVDEGDEAPTDIEGAALAWRISQNTPPLAPGNAIERAIKVRILPGTETGSSRELEISAAASNDELTIRSERKVLFSLAPPQFQMEMSGGSVFDASQIPQLVATLMIPSGRIENLSVTLEGSTAVADYKNIQTDIGEGIICDAGAEPEFAELSVRLRLGTCAADTTKSDSDRTIRFRTEVALKDADPFASPNVIAAARTIRIHASATSGDRLLSEAEPITAKIAGPLVGARLVEVPEGNFDAGDSLKVRYNIVNRGDAPIHKLKIKLVDDGKVDCDFLVVKDGSRSQDACATGVPMGGDLDIGASRDVELTARLRTDARFDDAPFLGVKLAGDGSFETPLPDAPYRLKLPPAPVLSMTPDSEWRLRNAIVSTRIGDTATIQMAGTLPEGRYPATLRLLSRLVDAQTGEPIGPASLQSNDLNIEVSGKVLKTKLNTETEEGWSVISVKLDEVSVPAGAEDDARRYEASVNLGLRDQSEARAGRMLEITAEIEIFGDKVATGQSWIESLIVEPALDLSLRSLDEDRSIELDTSAEVAALACNRGMAAAHALVLGVRIPQGMLLDKDKKSRFAKVPLESIGAIGDVPKLFAGTTSLLGETVIDSSDQVLRGVMTDDQALGPNTCAVLTFGVRPSGQYNANMSGARLEAFIDPYTGRAGGGGRIYSSLTGGEIRFTLPQVHFGPVSEIEINDDEVISHTASLEIPPGTAPYTVDLATESTAKLDWTILRLNEDGVESPWRNGVLIEPGKKVDLRFEADRPERLPLGWIDTTLVRALVLSSLGGDPISVATRLVSRRSSLPGGEIRVEKLLALDRDCDGQVDDERVQDALFEPVKDAEIGDCVIFHVSFVHEGDREVEQIILRDQVPPGTKLRSDAVEILRAPEPLQKTQILPPETGKGLVVWRFEGLFKPGAEGEVSYAVKLTSKSSESQK